MHLESSKRNTVLESNGSYNARLNCLWISSPSVVKLFPYQVHIWRIHLDLSSNRIYKLKKLLSPYEIAKVDKFYFEMHRRRYIARHGLLRIILSKYISSDPDQIQFSYSKSGKPELMPIKKQKLPSFNLSYSNELALCAITLNRSIGIDVEYIRENINVDLLAEHYFKPYEYKMINALSIDQRKKTFFDLWTLKEAYLKGTSEEIDGFEKIEFSISPNEPPELISNRENISESSLWSIYQLIPLDGYTASLAVEGNEVNINRFYKI